MSDKEVKIIYLEDLVLVKTTKSETYKEDTKEVEGLEKGAYIEVTTSAKTGLPEFKIYDKNKKGVGIMDITGNLKSINPNYKNMANVKILEMLEKAKAEKEKLHELKENRRLQLQKEAQEAQMAQENEEQNDKDEDQVPNRNLVNQNKEKEKNKNNDSKDLLKLSSRDMAKYKSTLITDPEFKKQLVSNTKELDYLSLRVVMVNGEPKLMAQEHDSKNYVEIPARVGARGETGRTDSFEYGEEKEDQGKGQVMTFVDRNGNDVKLNISMTGGGQIIVRDEGTDRDGDGDSESRRINTDTYTPPTHKDLSKNRPLDNQEKERIGIDTPETNEGRLSDKQIKEILDEKEVPEDARRKIISQMGADNPTRDELNKMIDNETSEKEYDEDEIDIDPHEHKHEHTHGFPIY